MSKSREAWPGQKKAGDPASRKERRKLSHVDRLGRPRMVDVSDKPATARRATAEATVKMDQETLTLVIDGAGAKAGSARTSADDIKKKANASR